MDEILTLFHVEEFARGHGGLFVHIHAEALRQLAQINADLAPPASEPKEPAALVEDTSTTVEPRKEDQWPETSSANTDPEATSPNEAESGAAASSPAIRRTL